MLLLSLKANQSEYSTNKYVVLLGIYGMQINALINFLTTEASVSFKIFGGSIDQLIHSFFPALLRYTEMLCKFKLYNVMTWYMYILQNNYHSKLLSTSITSFFCMVRTFNILLFSNLQVCNTVFLTIVTMLYFRYLELIP